MTDEPVVINDVPTNARVTVEVQLETGELVHHSTTCRLEPRRLKRSKLDTFMVDVLLHAIGRLSKFM